LAQAIVEPNNFPHKYSNILKPNHSSYLSAYEAGTECSETSAYKIQTPGNYPEESIQHSEHGGSLKSRIYFNYFVSVACVRCVGRRNAHTHHRSRVCRQTPTPHISTFEPLYVISVKYRLSLPDDGSYVIRNMLE
jgi:hypothetical protein